MLRTEPHNFEALGLRLSGFRGCMGGRTLGNERQGLEENPNFGATVGKFAVQRVGHLVI